MNKKIIALAVAAATASSLATAAEVYNQDGVKLDIGGRAEFRGDFGGYSNGKDIDGTMENNSRFRLNVGGETEITDKLAGFGFYEAEQGVKSTSDNDATDTFTQRYAYAGLKGEYGALSFGRQDTAAVQISQMSDVTTYTGAQKEFISAANEQVNNTILYTGSFDALTVKASYVAGEEDDTDGFGISATYTLPMGLGFGLGYSEDGKATDTDDTTTKGKATIAGINYSMDALYLGATYTQGDTGNAHDEEFEGVEFAAVYSFENNFALKGAYQKSEIDDNSTKYNKSDFFEITGDYAFSSNLNAYVAYKFNNLDKEDMNITTGQNTDAENSLRLGLLYSF